MEAMGIMRRWGVFAFVALLLAIPTIMGIVNRHFSKGRFSPTFPLGRILRPPDDTSAIAIDGDRVWAGGKNGIVGLDRLSGKVTLELSCHSDISYVTAILVDSSGTLWVGHENGLTKFDGKGCYTYGLRDGLPDRRVNALFQDRDGRLWVGTWGGAALLEGNRWRVLKAADGLADDMVRVICQDRFGAMWFGSYVAPRGGISICEDGSCRIFSTASGLPHNNITALLGAADGSVWAGTGLLNRGGAVQFERSNTGWAIKRVLKASDGLAGEKVRSLFEDRDGVFWFGSESDGLARLDSGHWQTFSERDGLSSREIKVIKQDVDGNLWLGTRYGITLISAKTLQELRAH
jgi:ligand-binding sensor domain-containing protein